MIFAAGMDKKNKTVAFYTLGCKLNFAETSEIGRSLEKDGYTRVRFGQDADVSVIHTCSVTGQADRKTRQAIKKAVKSSPGGIIVAMGCYAQLRPGEMAGLEGVDLVLGTREKFDLSKYLEGSVKKGNPEVYSCGLENMNDFFPAQSAGERTRAFLKVQDGCNYTCSYCTIPGARGQSRNPEISLIVNRAENIASQEIKEIVLTGVNIGDFGRSTGESFTELVKALDNAGLPLRFRISSIEPNLLSDEIIDITAASANFTPHFHIPLQSGSDKILRAMGRRYLRETFENRVKRIKTVMPGSCIGADVIVGFPGETDADFMDTVNFINGLEISYLHVFTYSERPGTPASTMKSKVPNRIRDERSKLLHELSDKKKLIFYESQIGSTRDVIFERKTKTGRMSGFTENYVEVETKWNEGMLHDIKKVKLTGLENTIMQCEVITGG